jgi:glucose-1-phosphate thymidylyltransferase
MKQAVILAAGEGRRLRPFTVNKPKAMISIAGKPIVQYVIESLAANGIRDIILIVGYQKEQIFDYIGDGRQFGVSVRYINQTAQIGTANALAQAFGSTDDEFVVLSGNRLIAPDTLTEIIQAKCPAILVRREGNPSRYGVVKIVDGKLVGIVEKPSSPESNMVNGGIYSISNRLYKYIETELSIPDAINNMLLNGEQITVIENNKTWLDVVYPWDILSLNASILQQTHASQNGTIEPGVSLRGLVVIGKDTIIRSNAYICGPVLIGNGCEIGPNTCIFPATSIADNVVISPFTEIRNSVIGNDVRIDSSCIIQDSVIDEGCTIGPHFSAYSTETEIKIEDEHYSIRTGAMLGRSCCLGSAVTAESGAILGNNSHVKSLRLFSGNIPDRSMVV